MFRTGISGGFMVEYCSRLIFHSLTGHLNRRSIYRMPYRSNLRMQLRLTLYAAIAVCCFFTNSAVNAQFIESAPQQPKDGLSFFTHSVSYDLFSVTPEQTKDERFDNKFFGQADNTIKVETKKSPYLAAALSLIIPGLGEYYVGDQVWRGMIFTGLEIGLWYGRYHWTKLGDDSLIAFHAWADSLWSPTKYSEYLDSLLVNKQ